MPEQNLPEWAVKIGAEVRQRTDQLPVNESYLVDVTELLREMTERELAEQRLRCSRERSRSYVGAFDSAHRKE